MNSFKRMLIQYGYIKMKCGNISKQTKMKSYFKFKTVSVTISGDYCQVMFHDGLDTGSNFARLEREQTSRGCPVTRTLKELHQERKANDGGQ